MRLRGLSIIGVLLVLGACSNDPAPAADTVVVATTVAPPEQFREHGTAIAARKLPGSARFVPLLLEHRHRLVPDRERRPERPLNPDVGSYPRSPASAGLIDHRKRPGLVLDLNRPDSPQFWNGG